MKLIHHALRHLLVPFLLIFTIWGATFYFLIIHEINDETNDTLENYKELIIRSAIRDSSFLKSHDGLMTRYYIREIPKEKADVDKVRFFDTTTYIEIEMEYEPVRVLQTCFRMADDRYYELTIEMSTLEKDDMIETIATSIAICYLLLILCMLIVSHWAFRKSTRPLYKLLDWLDRFRVGQPHEPLDNPTSVHEFKTLNQVVEESTRRSTELYNKQKQFVENAAHELQTPLAVCVNKLELLAENPNCTERQLEEIASLHQTVSGIVRLNKSLLLLSRIDNRQFPDEKEIRLDQQIQAQLDDLEMLYEDKKIKVDTSRLEPLPVQMNESLATALTINLLKNAFVHNHEGGTIEVVSDQRHLLVANTGEHPGELDRDRLFARFGKQSQRKESNGLGLAIVKSIAELYGFKLSYRYHSEKHIFQIFFPER